MARNTEIAFRVSEIARMLLSWLVLLLLLLKLLKLLALRVVRGAMEMQREILLNYCLSRGFCGSA